LPQTLTAADCLPNSDKIDWTGKAIIVKPEALSPEFRTSEHQLVLCTGGFGAKPDAMGRAVYADELHSGKKTRYDRQNIAGIADPSKLPEWAVKKLAEMGTEKAQPQKKCEKPAKTLQDKLTNAKKKAAENSAKPNQRGKKPSKDDGRE
jgi:hypothetical protein